MGSAFFVVALGDLEAGPKDVDWELPEAWLAASLGGTEATTRGQPGRARLTLTKTGKDVVVRGRVRAALIMPCARSLCPTDVEVDAEISLLLAPEEREAPSPRRRRGREPPEPESLSDGLAAADTYSGEIIVLDEFLREFILLELPMFPLHPDAQEAIAAAPEVEPRGDPRLAPLAAIKRRLEGRDEE